MTNQRKDSVDRHYLSVKRLEKLLKLLSWVNITLSFSLLFMEKLSDFQYWITITFVIGTALYGTLSIILGVMVLPSAESHRSTNLIADSLGVALDSEETNRYYNNNLKPSVMRLGMNVFENSLFSRTITEKMLVSERIKVGCWLMLLLVLLLLRSTSLEVISFVAQAIFTTSLLNDYLRLENARYQFHRIHKEFWNLFIKGIPASNRINQGIILNLASRYEATKASLTTSLDSKIFNNINDEVTREWEGIKSKLKLN